MTIISVFGTRPQYIKHAVLLPHLQQYFTVISIDTTQHYDDSLSNDIIKDLGIPQPVALELDVSLLSPEQRIEQIKNVLQKKFEQEDPIAVITYGDTDSTIAAAKAAKDHGCTLIHVEAGERSGNLDMPEESNRINTDKLADLLFCVSTVGSQNLADEGITQNVLVAGDLMKDLLLKTENSILTPPLASPYYFATIHRNYTQNNKAKMAEILSALNNLDARVIFPIHPGTQKKLAAYDLSIGDYTNIEFIAPLKYSASVQYQKFSEAVITDSGGIQKEAYWLKKKCITIRKETEWTQTLKGGWNVLLYENIKDKLQETINAPGLHYEAHLYGDGNAGKFIADEIHLHLNKISE